MMAYFVFFVLSAILFIAHPSPVEEENRIFKGREANEGEFPWMVFIRMTDELTCGGAIISPSYLLTAAHCVKQWSATDLKGVVGSVDREQGYMVEFEEYLIHPEYGQVRRHLADLALLKFKSPLTFTNFIRPICIGGKDSFTLPGNEVLQMGWGRYRNDSADVTKRLKVTDVGRLISESYCHRLLQKLNIKHAILNGRLCVKNSEVEGVCEGDSGGPLVYKSSENGYVVIGVVSIGFYVNCTVTNEFPELYTNVAYYSKWITETAEEPVCIIQ